LLSASLGNRSRVPGAPGGDGVQCGVMDAIDLALVLAVDGSASVTYEEFGLIAGGMATALRDPVVVKGLLGGPARSSACSLLLWSGAGAQEVLTDWTLIASEADAAGFADAVDAMPRVVR